MALALKCGAGFAPTSFAGRAHLQRVQNCKAICQLQRVQNCKAICQLQRVQNCKAICQLQRVQNCKAICQLQRVQNSKAICQLQRVQYCKGSCELQRLRYCKGTCELQRLRHCKGVCELRRLQFCNGVGQLRKVARGRIRGLGVESRRNAAIRGAQDVIQRDSVEQDEDFVRHGLSELVRHSAMSRGSKPPEVSLREGRWVKLICGASFEDVVDVRNLSLVYTLAGVDCIDCAADSAVVAAVLEGVAAAQHLARHLDSSETFAVRRPWIMVSINDDEDPHFRKAEFDPALCPSDCPRPCERVCPAAAIAFDASTAEERLLSSSLGGVVTERCYGCGRCLPVCPLGLIHARTYVRDLKTVADLLSDNDIDAIEIHTGAGHLEAFHRVVGDLADVLQSLKLIAVSVPDLGDRMVPALASMYESLRPVLKGLNLWQLDGRPMSGDIGAGATRAAVALAASVAASEGCPPGYLQLAGGTNGHTIGALEKEGLFLNSRETKTIIAGVAYGGYARKIVTKYLQKMENCHEPWDFTNLASPSSSLSLLGIEHYPSLLLGALQEATALVGPSKGVLSKK